MKAHFQQVKVEEDEWQQSKYEYDVKYQASKAKMSTAACGYLSDHAWCCQGGHRPQVGKAAEADIQSSKAARLGVHVAQGR